MEVGLVLNNAAMALVVNVTDLLSPLLEGKVHADLLFFNKVRSVLVHVGVKVVAKEELRHILLRPQEQSVSLDEGVGDFTEGFVSLCHLANFTVDGSSPVGIEELLTELGDELGER